MRRSSQLTLGIIHTFAAVLRSNLTMPPKRRNDEDDNQSFKQSRIDGVSGGADGGSDGDEPGVSGDIAIPIFLQKTYRMIESCDPSLCSWTEDGEMFVVKAPVS